MNQLKVKEYLINKGFGERFIEFDESTATVEAAAIAIGCESDQIAKSITLYAPEKGYAILVVASGSRKIDNKLFKDTFGDKAKMLKYEDVEDLVGHRVGGVCPFEVKKSTKVYLDESLKRQKILYPAGGSSNTVVRLEFEEFLNLCDFIDWVSVTK
ncbi:prolyl-tRNA editing protein [Myroides marinus]|jgi:prolyl-tRNA editing enzyme YbaK/EbsC (Cys-tRNA(Pro) deacylase)|uniref:YbaK/EbsC family protein n=1 Tax=Myroides marinus TaxID=703342 RepID=UPI0007421C3F|nr:YbaK/EbsC family protein [Myroides marinus]KUF43485.1 prolyl-tRNA editing protein [Myroides marinus]MDM1350863.1 YbaK/EbsC family protein [Myroides marinus]MDM1358070.1 YbaK/EbsC family protein [Myroides marinus]MDM1382002.1 YbaK/EbsC family protein [Myroides marinus]